MTAARIESLARFYFGDRQGIRPWGEVLHTRRLFSAPPANRSPAGSGRSALPGSP